MDFFENFNDVFGNFGEDGNCGFLYVVRKWEIEGGVLVIVVMVRFFFMENIVKLVSRIMIDIMSLGVYVNMCWNSYMNDECIFLWIRCRIFCIFYVLVNMIC